jgi:hypothetical protein
MFMKPFDRRTGTAILAARGTTTQQAVANAMRDRGHKWSQSTVWSVEAGERPLKFAEANDLAQILGITINDLSSDPIELEATLLSRRHADAYRTVVDAAVALFDLKDEIEALIERVDRVDTELGEPTLAALRRMADEPVEGAISAAQRERTEHPEHGPDRSDQNFADQIAQEEMDWERGK